MRDHDNLRTAVMWSLASGDGLGALRLVSAVGVYMWLQGAYGELCAWLDRAHDAVGAQLPPAIRAWAEYARATNTFDPSERIDRLRLTLGAFREVGDDRMEARCLIDLANYQNFQDEHASALANAQEALAIGRRLGDDVLMGAALGEMALATARVERAIPIAREATDRLRARGALAHCAEFLSTLGLMALISEEYDRAEELEREALRDALATGDQWSVAFVHGNTGLAAFAAGRFAAAEQAFRDELTAAHACGFRTCYFEGLLGLAALAARNGDGERAAILEAAARALSDRPIAPSETAIYAPLHAELSRARERLGEPAWTLAAEPGTQMTAEVAIAFAFDARAIPAAS
jgi:hypothetical protein